MTYPTTPQKKDTARGRAGKGGQAVALHHDFDAILEAAAAAEEGNSLQHSAEAVGEGRAVDSKNHNSSTLRDISSGGASSAVPERKTTMECGGSSGQQMRRRGVSGRVQSRAGAARAHSTNQACKLQCCNIASAHSL